MVGDEAWVSFGIPVLVDQVAVRSQSGFSTPNWESHFFIELALWGLCHVEKGTGQTQTGDSKLETLEALKCPFIESAGTESREQTHFSV